MSILQVSKTKKTNQMSCFNILNDSANLHQEHQTLLSIHNFANQS